MKPFIKWVGGKTQILEDVLQEFPTEMNNYYEPFLGGGSVLLELMSRINDGKIRVLGNVYASDLNSNLIALYKNVQSNVEELLIETRKLIDEFSQCRGNIVNRNATTIEEAQGSKESYYFWTRSQFNALTIDERETPRASAMFLFINKTCFRGLYREGPRGFNVPYGNYKNPNIMDEHHLRDMSVLIKDVVFATSSFTDSLKNVVSGDFVYLDPPYAPETNTSFVGYTADGFNIDEHKRLFAICHGMKAKFVMSNANVDFVRQSFPTSEYKTKIITCRRTINSKNPESVTTEVIISN
jgi:DNA adenine methylase